MRVVFMGTPEFAVPSLRLLAQRHEVTLVVTRPDAVRGRGKKLVPSPVKAAAQELNIPVLEATRIRQEQLERVRQAQPDVVCVAAYGALLPDSLLQLPPLGCVNVHGSLLPRWRGAAPIQRAILAGDERVGVSIMRIAHELDAGAYCRQASVSVDNKPCSQIMSELAQLGGRELVAALDDIANGRAQWVPQDEALVTYSPKITKSEMRLDPADSARANKLRVQASTDEAPARLQVAGKGLRAVEAVLAGDSAGQKSESCEDGQAPRNGQNLEKGQVLVDHGHVLLGCADGAIELLRVKPDGKREMDARSWSAGLHAQGSAELTWGRV